MVLSTVIARISDGLPLAASVQDDEQGRSLVDYQNQAKMLMKKLDARGPERCSIETPPFIFHYLIKDEVCYLVLSEKTFSRKLAFSYLDDLQQEFSSQYGRKVATVSRPYSFIEFDNYIQKAKKTYIDPRARRNLGTLNNELLNVQKIMVQNIDDVLQRGTLLSELDNKAQNLASLSTNYKKDARHLNRQSTIFMIGGTCFVLFFLWWLFF
ncbi:vesicle-trafficking protein SEC22b-like [Artemia franciscana]|uniref:vesicle-trafficking protein SEC22b-like n=1 Tax=Artemia franciscana TaxID=6661 RepID=UPI0032DB8382